MEYISGAISGVAQTMIGHPFDTYKVMMQNNSFTFNKILKTNPFVGIRYPMFSSVISCSLTFGIHNNLKNNYGLNDTISGFISGAVIAPIVFISDNAKIRRQLGQKMNMSINQLINQQGKIASFWRESIAFSAYFYSFNYCKNELDINPFISGGIAGITNWTVTYPFDIIRSRQIANNITIYEAYKLGKLWSGYLPCAIRAVKVNAVGFYVFELFNQINKKEKF